ncbi:hypothetical protein B0A49_09373 [Cryomyces minteri]|uniref:PAN2-PAN3 deadenylation complex subunit PAN3 n=1 Tax=Cryomyces minteri TaxID=331657 RepID=A0A4V5NF98_9PEZI|nr:hypothetical protein B0A49_09398 [Cryomyces minteri]TKA62044.1 hypothetical protein B0A49_09373 [Cryomyces minteri]
MFRTITVTDLAALENINSKNTLCRNVSIYGKCRNEQDGCPYSHGKSKFSDGGLLLVSSQSAKRRFNVDSPSFKPLTPATNGTMPPSRNATISAGAANAAVFTPKAAAPPILCIAWQTLDEFSMNSVDASGQTYNQGQLGDSSAFSSSASAYDPFTTQSTIPDASGNGQQAHIIPYAHDGPPLAGSAYYPGTATFAQPPQYHLYAPMGPHRENLLAYQRPAHDFFIPNDLRQELQRRNEATLQVFPNSTLPQVDDFHTLVPLDINNQRNTAPFGYQTWVYKAVDARDGNTYVLRRLEGYRLTDARAIDAAKGFLRVNNGNIVNLTHDSFTTRAFGDSSLIFVTDFHPCSKTLAEHHFGSFSRNSGGRHSTAPVPEQVLWSYIVQLACALRALHSRALAARVIIPSKVLLTGKNRIRLNGCGILDVTQYDAQRSISELQQDDLVQLGRLILCIAADNPNAHLNTQKAMDNIRIHHYSVNLYESIVWLLGAATALTSQQQQVLTSPAANQPSLLQQQSKTIDTFLASITTQVTTVFDSSLRSEDLLTSTLSRELENGRLVRLMAKLNLILERPEQSPAAVSNNSINSASTATSMYLGPMNSGTAAFKPANPATAHIHQHHQQAQVHHQQSQAWSETGERYYLKLFRDYVFHQVDVQGNPVVDLGHVILNLNKLDAGTEEKVMLMSRDEQNVMVVSYKELKRGVESAFSELMKAAGSGRR